MAQLFSLGDITRMEILDVESRLKFTFPARHRQALLDSSDPIHEACAFLTLSDIVSQNDWIHGSEFGEPWPDFLIAFASNQCGDYFAYDTRQHPASIIYIDPDKTVAENLETPDKLCHDTFEHWYESYVA